MKSADRLLVVGLDEPEYQDLKTRLSRPVVYHGTLPRVRLRAGRLYAEDDIGRFVPVSAVVFHGIFEDDLPFLAALALWGGPCLPGARGMMDCRQRIPGLVRALAVSRFGGLARGYADRGTGFTADGEMVAKWGEWHCGENKVKFTGAHTAGVPTLFEPFVPGRSVRVHILGDQAWQLLLAGDDWKKSIHHAGAGFMDMDPELLEDARVIQGHFSLEMLAIDYIIDHHGHKYLLEVNHIPNVTLFPELRRAYLEYVVRWASADPTWTATAGRAWP